MKTILTVNLSNFGGTHIVGENLTLCLSGTKDIVEKLTPDEEGVVGDFKIIQIMKKAIEDIGEHYESFLKK